MPRPPITSSRVLLQVQTAPHHPKLIWTYLLALPLTLPGPFWPSKLVASVSPGSQAPSTEEKAGFHTALAPVFYTSRGTENPELSAGALSHHQSCASAASPGRRLGSCTHGLQDRPRLLIEEVVEPGYTRHPPVAQNSPLSPDQRTRGP